MTTEMSPVSMTDKLAEFLLPTKGFQFSSYAWWAIKRGMERCFSNSRAVRFPAYLLSQFRRLNQVIADLWQEDGEKPKVSLVAKALEMTEETDTEITAARDLTVYLLARKCLLSYEDIARILSFRSPSRCEMAMILHLKKANLDEEKNYLEAVQRELARREAMNEKVTS
ncbi:hypothetical protein IH992_29290 [Candidatus Poribacteria bacterium]|nr:hypothetical protein [Candidatus Poribacteria bacterium]